MEDRPTPFLTTPVAVLIGATMVTAALLINGGVIKLNGAQATSTPTAPSQQAAAQPTILPITIEQVKNAFSNAQVKFGDSNRKLVVLEIADPSCPYCHVAAGRNPEISKQVGSRFTYASDGGSYIPPVPELEKLLSAGKIAFAYIYYPGHGNGEMGAKAMYCANDKGKFWEVHNLLMTNAGYDLQNTLVKNDKTKSAQVVEFLKSAIDPTFLKECLDSGKYDARLQQDTSLTTSLNPSGTPDFFLNATRFDGAYSYKDMESAVKSAGI